jgi:hypothetical protein
MRGTQSFYARAGYAMAEPWTPPSLPIKSVPLAGGH